MARCAVWLALMAVVIIAVSVVFQPRSVLKDVVNIQLATVTEIWTASHTPAPSVLATRTSAPSVLVAIPDKHYFTLKCNASEPPLILETVGWVPDLAAVPSATSFPSLRYLLSGRKTPEPSSYDLISLFTAHKQLQSRIRSGDLPARAFGS